MTDALTLEEGPQSLGVTCNECLQVHSASTLTCHFELHCRVDKGIETLEEHTCDVVLGVPVSSVAAVEVPLAGHDAAPLRFGHEQPFRALNPLLAPMSI